jgi:hypothetical protein
MDRSLSVHAVLAILASTLAYVAWTAPKPDKDSTVVMVPGSADKLSRVSWHEESWDVSVVKEGDQVSVTAVKIATGDAGVTPPAPKTFPGSKEADELFNKLAPLKAARALGKLAGEKQKTMGLETPKSSLTLRIGDEDRLVEIGDAAYGTGDLYGRTADGEVFLIPSATLSSIRHGASSLMDRNLIAAKEDKVERLSITSATGGRELVQRYAEDRTKAFYADPAEPDAKLETTGNWLNRLLRLRVVDLVTDAPSGNPAIEVELFAGKGALGKVQLWPAGDKTALATSSRFKSAVTVSKAEVDALVKDLDSVLSEGK